MKSLGTATAARAWEPVPGLGGVTLLPFVRKLDTISSNSYLLATPDVIVLVDPGGLESQAHCVAEAVREARAEKARPLVVFLTHIHTDHFCSVLHERVFGDERSTLLAVHALAAPALAAGDRRMTLAELTGQEVRPVLAGLPLFASDGPRRERFANGAAVTIEAARERWPGHLRCERITFGPGPALEVFQTPGHSPDSICLRLGPLLFIGDVLFAASPGIAGVPGWDQGALLRSLDGLVALCGEGGPGLVLPGHGNPVRGADAARLLGAVRDDAAQLHGIAEVNAQRVEELAAYADACIEQVHELIAVMAGRLMCVSYLLAELGEGEAARSLGSRLNTRVIDDVLAMFHAFTLEYRAGRERPHVLALKAGQVVAKVARTFRPDDVAGVVDGGWIDRVGRLLSGYTHALRGFSPPPERRAENVAAVLQALLARHSQPVCSDDDLLGATDDQREFVRQLESRAGTRPLLAAVEVELLHEEPELVAALDRVQFEGLLTCLLEDLVGRAAKRIAVGLARGPCAHSIVVTGAGLHPDPAPGSGPSHFLRVLARRAGATLALEVEAASRTYRLMVAAVL